MGECSVSDFLPLRRMMSHFSADLIETKLWVASPGYCGYHTVMYRLASIREIMYFKLCLLSPRHGTVKRPIRIENSPEINELDTDRKFLKILAQNSQKQKECSKMTEDTSPYRSGRRIAWFSVD